MAVSESSKPSKVPKARKTKAKKEEGEPEAQAPPETPAAAEARALDFSQPTRFTPEIRHRISAALDPFCEAISTHLSGELSVEVSASIAGVDQSTWAAAKAKLPADSVAVAVEEGASERTMLLSVELPLLLQALECLLGGSAAQAPAHRHLTDVDWVLARGFLEKIVGDLSLAWSDIGGPKLSRGDLDIEGDAGLLTWAGEPTLSVDLRSEIDGQASAMSLLVPWAAVEPFAENIRSAGTSTHSADGEGSDALRRGVAGAQVLLRAEVGSVEMGIARMLELLPGTLLELQERSEDGVRVFAEGASLGRGRPGRSGTRRAIKLESTDPTPSRADTYASLGRAELERARAQANATGETADGQAILSSIFVRVWAELGRTHLPLGHALELAPGGVVELDQDAHAPVELFANGLCFANGSLVVTGDGEWGVQVERLL
jgi:flagellar motor switch protein FliM